MTEERPATAETVIELRDVHKAFGSNRVLQGLDLDVLRGETLVIIGRSGIGKSVALRHIVGLMKADSGRVLVFGQDMARCSEAELRSVRRRIGYLFQDGALLNWLTVGENVALPLREVYRLGKPEIEQRVHDAVTRVELQEAVDRLPSQISGGMRKRAGLARALVCRPDVILYDEPTSGLDPISSSNINQLLRSLQAALGVTQIVVTHDMDSAYTIGDRIALLHDGRILALGTPEEIRSSDNPAVSQFIHGRMEGPLAHGNHGRRPAATAHSQEA